MTDAASDGRERLVALETRFDATLPHLATKADIQGVKVWMLSAAFGSLIAALLAGAALIVGLLRITT